MTTRKLKRRSSFGMIASLILYAALGGLSWAGPPAGKGNDNACPRKVGVIQQFDFNLESLVENMTKYFPVDTLQVHTLESNSAIDGIDAVVDEMEAEVNDMKSKGIRHILIAGSSVNTSPFIEGSAGSLGGVHSDVRHPNVIFSGDRQGTFSIDNAQNWYRAGVDFVTPQQLGPELLLPDVSGISPQPQFILATDYSPAVDPWLIPYRNHAIAAGYEVLEVDLQWNDALQTFENIAGLGDLVALATPQSSVGIAITGAEEFFTDFTTQALADPDIYDPANTNVSYIGINYVVVVESFQNPGTIPVDISYGVVSGPEIVVDPKGVNHFLLKLGYPDDAAEAFNHDDVTYVQDGIIVAQAFAWLATCGRRNLDPRYTMDGDGQYVAAYIQENVQLAGTILYESVLSDPVVNPRWQELNNRRGR